MRTIPEILDKCVSKLQAQGKSKSSAFAICTASLKKAGNLEQLLEKLDEAEKGSADLETYLQENELYDNSKSKSPTFRKFSSQIVNFPIESLSLSDQKTTTIQCLRMGKFKHPWYGVLKFDLPFFESMVKNFDADIPNPEIAFDFSHQPDYGAAAWISKVFVEDNNLMADVTLTDRGKKSIKSGEFKYFSVEYTNDYAEYEFTEKVDSNGKTVEEETKISHGPTVLGGGLTNRPFIKGMAPVSLSEDGDMIELEEVKDDQQIPQSTKEVKEPMKTLDELKVEQDQTNARIKELEDGKDDKASKEELEGLATKLEEISAAVKELSENGDEDATKTLEELETTKTELETATKQLEAKDEEVKELSDNVKTLTETVTKLMKTSKILQEDKHKLSVEKKLEVIRKLSFPATMKVIEKFAFSEDVKDFSVTLSEGEGDDKKDIQKSFLDVVESILESIPEEHRFTENESSESIITPTGNSKEASIEDVEKFAEEKKITFEEALVEFSKEGKIE